MVTEEPITIPGTVEVLREVPFGTGGGRQLTMHIFTPKGRPAGTRSPAVVYIHGGWWRSGSKDRAFTQRGAIASDLAARGYVVAAVEYRLSAEAQFPAQIEDVKCGVRFLRAHADEYGIDPGRIGCFGPSAGGHLSALLATSGNAKDLEGSGGWADQSSKVQCAVDWYGPTDVFQMPPEFTAGNEATVLVLGGPLSEHRELAERLNPIKYISKDCPPVLIMHGEEDTSVPIEHSRMLDAALKKAGVESHLVTYPGKGHEHLGPDSIERIYAFFDKHLRRK